MLCYSMTTVSELVDKGDVPEERKKHVKDLLHSLGYAAGSAGGKAFLKITKDMTDAGMSIADANAILAEVEPLQGSLRLLSHECISQVRSGSSFTASSEFAAEFSVHPMQTCPSAFEQSCTLAL